MSYYYVVLLTELRIHFKLLLSVCMLCMFLFRAEIRALDVGGLVCKNPTRIRTQAEYFENAYWFEITKSLYKLLCFSAIVIGSTAQFVKSLLLQNLTKKCGLPAMTFLSPIKFILQCLAHISIFIFKRSYLQKIGK